MPQLWPGSGDTGWVAVAVNSGWSMSDPVMVRRINGVVYWRGRVSGNSSAAAAIFTIPPGFRPITSAGLTQYLDGNAAPTRCYFLSASEFGPVSAGAITNLNLAAITPYPAAA